MAYSRIWHCALAGHADGSPASGEVERQPLYAGITDTTHLHGWETSRGAAAAAAADGDDGDDDEDDDEDDDA